MIAEAIAALFLTTMTMFGTEIEPEEVKISCYLPTGNKTYDGTVPYYGLCAVNKEHLGDIALLFDADMNFIDMYEVRDIGGNKLLRQGKAIDVFQENMEDARQFIRENGDHGYVIWITAEG